jgi:hydrogenase maturation factor
VLTKGIAIEGTSLLAREFGDRLRAVGVAAQTLEKAANYLFEPGISVLREARAAVTAGGVTAMHDPTEGGLATALAELAEASGVGLEVEEEAVPLLPECEELCRVLEVDPWGLISSGALLLTAVTDSTQHVLDSMERIGVVAAVIGKVTEQESGLKLRRRGSAAFEAMPVFARDEIARLFGE